jgi:hypothetical protein
MAILQLERWENGLKAKERRILMTHWLAAANKKQDLGR